MVFYLCLEVKMQLKIQTLNLRISILCIQVCGARVKTRDTLKQHRKKLHNLLTPVPQNAQVSEEMIRAAGEGQGILRDPHQHGVIVGVDLETGQQRHLVTMSGISSVPVMDQRIIGITNVQSILPQKM